MSRIGNQVRRAARLLATAWCIVGLALLGFLALNAVAQRVLVGMLSSQGTMYRVGFEDQSPEWLDAFTAETFRAFDVFHDASPAGRWEPYAYWRTRPHFGQFVNVDDRGLRRTVPLPPGGAAGDPPPERVFVFGGSSVWGVGAHDAYTVPSLIAERLARTGRPVEVTNFGQVGYVSTQEVIALYREIQQGRVPDVVIFFDGYNDISAALSSGGAGLSFNERQRVAEFNLLRSGTVRLLPLAVQNCPLAKLLTIARGASTLYQVPAEERGAFTLETFADDVLRVYAANVATVDALGERFGFDALYYWQPLVFLKEPRTADEESYIEGRESGEPIYEALYREFRRAAGDDRPGDESHPRLTVFRFGTRVHHLGDLFNTPEWEQRTAFYDRCHLVEAANQVVADRIVDDLLALTPSAVARDAKAAVGVGTPRAR